MGTAEVFVRAFVFPDEMIAEVNVGEAFLAAGLDGLRFEGEVVTAGIVFNGRGVVDEAAKSLKWDWEAAVSLSWMLAHLSTNSFGEIFTGIAEFPLSHNSGKT